MTLATRCPSCGTVFRVVQDQLRVSEGWVRCGRCDNVFHAVEVLFDIDSGEPVVLDLPGTAGVDDDAPAPATAPPPAPPVPSAPQPNPSAAAPPEAPLPSWALNEPIEPRLVDDPLPLHGAGLLALEQHRLAENLHRQRAGGGKRQRHRQQGGEVGAKEKDDFPQAFVGHRKLFPHRSGQTRQRGLLHSCSLMARRAGMPRSIRARPVNTARTAFNRRYSRFHGTSGSSR